MSQYERPIVALTNAFEDANISSPTNEEQFGSIDNICVVEYLEQVIISYIKTLSKRYNKYQANEDFFQSNENLPDSESECDEETDMNMTVRQTVGNPSPKVDDEDDTKVPFMITSLRIGDPVKNGLITSYSVEFRFYIGEDPSIIRKEYVVLNVMQEYNTEYPKAILSSLQREIDFHAKIIPEVEDWLISEGYFIPKLSGIHEFYDGVLHVDESKKDPFLMQRVLNEIEKTCQWKIQDPEKYLSSVIVTRYLIVEQDLEKCKYFKRTSETKLSINEIKSTLREMAFLQACSWIMETKTKKRNIDRWPFLQSINAFVVSSIPSVRNGLKQLTKILERVLVGAPDEKIILQSLKIWKSNVSKVFDSKMKQVSGSFPSTLLHLDLHLDSIYFYNDQIDETEEDTALPKKVSETSCNQSIKTDERGDYAISVESTETKFDDKKEKLLDFPEVNHSLFDKAYPSDHIICKISNWKTVSYGNPLLDVAGLLYTSIDIATRRVFTRCLLFYYHEIFQKTVEAFDITIKLDFKDIMKDYYNQFFMRILLSIGNITPTMKLKDEEVQNLVYGIREYLEFDCNIAL